MSSELEFVRLRLARVERQLKGNDVNLVLDHTGRGRLSATEYDTEAQEEYAIEARLLQHILAIAGEGQVGKALAKWRRTLGDFLYEHRQHYKVMQARFDEWASTPRHLRSPVAPQRPPAAWYTAHNGSRWKVDDRFLALLDDLKTRLDQWLDD